MARMLLGISVCLGVLMATVSHAQSFDENVYYQIKPRLSGKCLDIRNFSEVNGGQLQQWDCGGGAQANQLWRVVDTGAGSFRLVSAHTAKCVDVTNASTANGAYMQQYDCLLAWPQWNQVFTIEPVSTPGYYHVRPVQTGKCLDVEGVSTANGANIQQWDCGPDGWTPQEWTFVPVTTRTPLSHLKFIEYFNGGQNVQPWQLTKIVDHVGSTIYDLFNIVDPVTGAPNSSGQATIAATTRTGLKIDLAVFNDFFIWLPNCNVMHDPDCNAIADRRDTNGNRIDGGLRDDYVTYWNAIVRPAILPYVQAGVVHSFYFSNEPRNLYNLKFDFNESNWIVQTIARLAKNDPDAAIRNIPIQIVDGGYGATFAAYPPEIDWVGFDQYFDTPSNYQATLNAVKANLAPNQSIVLYPEAVVVKPKGSDSSTTPSQQDALVVRADYYINLALSEPRVIGLNIFLGPSQDNVPWVAPTPGDDGLRKLVGAWDMDTVRAKWRFLGRGLGLGVANVELRPGQNLFAGQYAMSPDGRFSLTYQTDGNLVLYRWDGVPIWWTGTSHVPGHTVMQTDGNLVVYDVNGTPAWNTGTWTSPGAYLRLLNNGNMVLVNSANAVIWQTGTGNY